jgi:hypothetical protein
MNCYGPGQRKSKGLAPDPSGSACPNPSSLNRLRQCEPFAGLRARGKIGKARHFKGMAH